MRQRWRRLSNYEDRRKHTNTHHFDEDVVDKHTARITVRRGNERVEIEQR